MEHEGSRLTFPLFRLQLVFQKWRGTRNKTGRDLQKPYLVVKFHPAPPSITSPQSSVTLTQGN